MAASGLAACILVQHNIKSQSERSKARRTTTGLSPPRLIVCLLSIQRPRAHWRSSRPPGAGPVCVPRRLSRAASSRCSAKPSPTPGSSTGARSTRCSRLTPKPTTTTALPSCAIPGIARSPSTSTSTPSPWPIATPTGVSSLPCHGLRPGMPFVALPRLNARPGPVADDTRPDEAQYAHPTLFSELWNTVGTPLRKPPPRYDVHRYDTGRQPAVEPAGDDVAAGHDPVEPGEPARG